jgi:hypothetical protein
MWNLLKLFGNKSLGYTFGFPWPIDNVDIRIWFRYRLFNAIGRILDCYAAFKWNNRNASLVKIIDYH